MCIAMHSYDDLVKYAKMKQSYIDEYSRCLELEADLSRKKDMVEKVVYDEHSNRFSRLEKQCISLEIKVQQSKESLQNDKPCNNQDALEYKEFFEINELKAQLQKKNTTISNLKDHIATLKGKYVFDCTAPVNNSNVIAPRMFKLDLPPLSPKHRKNREARVYYLKQTKEHADTLYEIVEQAKALKPLDNALDYACKFTTQIQQLLVYVSTTCLSCQNNSKKLVAVTPMNKNRQVRFEEPSTLKKEHKGQLGSRTSSSITRRIKIVSHHMYVVDYLNDVNASDRAKSKRAKKNEWKPTEDVDLLMGSRGTNLFTLSLYDMLKSSPICLLSKASKTESWLWHQRLSHLNFGTINELAKQGLVRDNGTEFVNQTLESYYEDVGISHQSLVARTPQQNGIVKRQNRTLA
ncbi:retrovirus-related pol polyprotein from transposon TNT 1-94 [Tanacetum coccineum]|uniref:Retrovirus-related pol polyprotein from transposon TNT 1-94 n=1 Tax=Tanacetum coccineum TaxID=301880 RepID=A0ABQ5IBR0_9ASTR